MGASEALTIPGACNGPLDSGNGGYASAIFAGLLDGPAEVSLRSPVPLDTPLVANRQGERSVQVIDGETLVAEVRAIEAAVPEVPEPVSLEEARLATTLYRGTDDGLFSRCFVCGLAREDSFGVCAGVVEGRDVVASPWTPRPSTADAAGNVRPEFIWAVLDCPTYFALYPDTLPMSFLARMSARIDAPVAAGDEHVVIGWPIGRDGRKHEAGSAVLSAEGEPLAIARVLMIEAAAG